jgi:predicted DCC family thiol-disulfide oxidoreductase YuxK
MDLSSRFPRLTETFDIDLRSLALLRATLGAVLLCTLLSALGEAAVWWSDAGVLPRSALVADPSPFRFSLHLANGEPWFITTLLTVQAVLALMFTLGSHTRSAGALSFLLWISLLNRNPMLDGTGELLLACLLFWSIFLPMGARWSIDAALSAEPPPQSAAHRSPAAAALMLQVLIVYFCTALLQSGPAWTTHQALGQLLSLDHQVTAVGAWMAQWPGLNALLDRAIGAILLLAPVLILLSGLHRGLRRVGLIALALLQLGAIICLQLGMLPWLALFALAAFVDSGVWDAATRWHQRRHPGPLSIYYDKECRFCASMCLLLREFLILPQASIAAAQDTARARTLMQANNSWVVIDADEQAYLKWAAFTILLRRSPLFGWLWPLVKASVLDAPGSRLYDFVARHRARFARITLPLLPPRSVNWSSGVIRQRLALFAGALMLGGALSTLGAMPSALAAGLNPILKILHLEQSWTLYAPAPPEVSGWLVVTGRRADGREVDVLHPQREAPSFEPPPRTDPGAPDLRWRSYHDRLRDPAHAAQRGLYASYLCRRWNDREAAPDQARQGQRLVSVKMIYMLQYPTGTTANSRIEQQVLWRQGCAAGTEPGAE